MQRRLGEQQACVLSSITCQTSDDQTAGFGLAGRAALDVGTLGLGLRMSSRIYLADALALSRITPSADKYLSPLTSRPVRRRSRSTNVLAALV